MSMTKKRKRKRKKKSIITSDDILGKDAIDPDGSNLGTVIKVHIDSNKMCITGITIDMGILKPDLYVGVDHIKHIGIDAVILKKVPTQKFKGLTVLSEEGKIIGEVKDIVLEGKKVKELVVKGKGFFKKAIPIKYVDIKEIGDKIILKAKKTLK